MGHREELLGIMQLTQEDLEANRGGRLSKGQQRSIVKSGVSNLIGSFVIALAMAAILAFIVNKPLVPVQWLLGGGLAAAAVIVGFVDYNRTRIAAADGKVETLTGPIRVYSVRRAGWYLAVADRSFRPPFHAWQVKNGEPYHVYVAQKANRIVSLEPDGWD